MYRLERWTWLAVAIVLSALAVPWFLWGNDRVLVGFPVWLWWHIGWMILASVVFWVFSNRAWGLGIEPDRDGNEPSGPSVGAPSEGGERP